MAPKITPRAVDMFSLVKNKLIRHNRGDIPDSKIKDYLLKYKFWGGTDMWNSDKIYHLVKDLLDSSKPIMTDSITLNEISDIPNFVKSDTNPYNEKPNISMSINPKTIPSSMSTGIPAGMPSSLPKLVPTEYITEKMKMLVRSDERNLVKYPQPTDFSIQLFPPSGLMNVSEFKLLSCIFPKVLTAENQNIDHFPYLILQIKEIGTQFISNNGKIRGFCPLTFETDTGQHKVFNGENSPLTTIRFSPARNMSALSISFLQPDGSPLLLAPILTTSKTENKTTPTAEIEYNPDPYAAPSNNPNEITAGNNETIDNFPVITFMLEITHTKKRENPINYL
jgi:hypothetical protein